MAGPNLVSFQGPKPAGGNALTSEIPVSAASPLPVTAAITSGVTGNVTLLAGTAAIGTLAGDTYLNISADGLTAVKITPGTLKAVTINTKGTVASTVTMKDGANTVAIIDSLNLSGTFNLNAACTANITATLTGTVAPNVTVTFQ